ncbi:hypothetical protein NPIL_643501 [Nephila pilipes]|uniref:Uncharacterized protein n=1 Tax=Nephila pilipes TaxID=299642 RepID=A0A8X6Q7H4_NEPPI|nr:hypothetical protein NPIL_643501 [Nephila pilipes]
MISEPETLNYKLNDFLFRFRRSLDPVMVEIPEKNLFNTYLRPRLDLIFPDICRRMKEIKMRGEEGMSECTHFFLGDSILFRNYTRDIKWRVERSWKDEEVCFTA